LILARNFLLLLTEKNLHAIMDEALFGGLHRYSLCRKTPPAGEGCALRTATFFLKLT
jgi:hypothetical protein